MTTETLPADAVALARPPYALPKLIFVWTVHLVSALAVAGWWLGAGSVSWMTVALAAVWFAGSSTAITAGYHRLFAHPTYRAGWPLRALYLLAGAAAFQGSALQWSAQHRDHHTFTDGARDPYNIKLGFWFAHMGWVVRQTDPDYGRVPDLQRDPLVRLQHRVFTPLALAVCFGVPWAIGGLWQEAWAALLLAGFVRLTLQWHMTFCVNSVAHRFGSQKYSSAHSATGNWWLAFLTWGEMDHNYHHTFPEDFRTGTRWWDFDPGKWWIAVCAGLGLASDLRRAQPARVVRASGQGEPRAGTRG